MNLYFNTSLANGYHSPSQRIRLLTEDWVYNNMFCPRCGNKKLEQLSNNKPVADFICPHCSNQYELKSKAGEFGKKIADGAYSTMISRITSNTNPDFFFLNYCPDIQKVYSFIIVPRHFIIPSIIEKRKPLSAHAQRAGWTSCNIILSEIPIQGRIFVINHEIEKSKKSIIDKLNFTRTFEANDIETRGWLFDILNCVNLISSNEFNLEEIYRFETFLSIKHPENYNIQPKIRQQLQLLRDKGYIEFLGGGRYKKTILCKE
ncbi:MAG: DpnI domain-containing protein [Eubacteriales bacterium]|nr:DpnI domain-containing protein [Eubacteriales bacterium]